MFDRTSAIAAINSDTDGAALLLSSGIDLLVSSGTIDCEPLDALKELRALESDIDSGEGADRLIGNDRLCRLAAGAIDAALDERRLMARLPHEAAITGPALSDALHQADRASLASAARA